MLSLFVYLVWWFMMFLLIVFGGCVACSCWVVDCFGFWCFDILVVLFGIDVFFALIVIVLWFWFYVLLCFGFYYAVAGWCFGCCFGCVCLLISYFLLFELLVFWMLLGLFVVVVSFAFADCWWLLGSCVWGFAFLLSLFVYC